MNEVLLVSRVLGNRGVQRIDKGRARAYLLHAKVRHGCTTSDVDLDRDVDEVGITVEAHVTFDKGETRIACDAYVKPRVGGGVDGGSARDEQHFNAAGLRIRGADADHGGIIRKSVI